MGDTELKRRWAMAGTEPIESGVEAIAHLRAIASFITGWTKTISQLAAAGRFLFP